MQCGQKGQSTGVHGEMRPVSEKHPPRMTLMAFIMTLAPLGLKEEAESF